MKPVVSMSMSPESFSSGDKGTDADLAAGAVDAGFSDESPVESCIRTWFLAFLCAATVGQIMAQIIAGPNTVFG
jgi:hypothetical protein